LDFKDKRDRIIVPVISKPEAGPNPLAKNFSCKNCGTLFYAYPPDDYHNFASRLRYDVQSGSTWIEIPYDCSHCPHQNILYWYNNDQKEIKHTTDKILLSKQLPLFETNYIKMEKIFSESTLSCRSCKSKNIGLADVMLNYNSTMHAYEVVVYCTNEKCHAILATLEVTKIGNFGGMQKRLFSEKNY